MSASIVIPIMSCHSNAEPGSRGGGDGVAEGVLWWGRFRENGEAGDKRTNRIMSSCPTRRQCNRSAQFACATSGHTKIGPVAPVIV
eukprot:5906749-Prymnesium_polylepis.2